jgi:hypothetical protein
VSIYKLHDLLSTTVLQFETQNGVLWPLWGSTPEDVHKLRKPKRRVNGFIPCPAVPKAPCLGPLLSFPQSDGTPEGSRHGSCVVVSNSP